MATTIKVSADLSAARSELEHTHLQLKAKDDTVSVIQVQLASRVHDVAHLQVCACACVCRLVLVLWTVFSVLAA